MFRATQCSGNGNAVQLQLQYTVRWWDLNVYFLTSRSSVLLVDHCSVLDVCQYDDQCLYNGAATCNLSSVSCDWCVWWCTRPDSSLRYRRYINHLLTYLLYTQGDARNQAICCWGSEVPNVLYGSVLTHLVCGCIFSDEFIANLLPSFSVKAFWKFIGIWWSCRQEYSNVFFYRSLSTSAAFLRLPVPLYIVGILMAIFVFCSTCKCRWCIHT